MRIICGLFFFLFLKFSLCSQEKSSPVVINALYVGEYFNNFSGGIKAGQTYLGLFDFGITLNTADIGLWNNGEFHAQIENTHGGTPSAEFLGDIQTASNIENGDHTYLYELWYRQQFNRFGFKIGVIDLNDECHVCESGGLFLNSSLGIMASASLNMPVPIFPMPALGFKMNYDISDRFSIQAAIWDGYPGDFENNKYNIEWKLDANEGFLYVFETNYRHNRGFIKLGSLYHSGTFEDLNNPTKSKVGNLQLHLIIDQILIEADECEGGKLSTFVQIGYLPDNTINPAPFYIGGGINLRGLFTSPEKDILGLAFAHINMSENIVNQNNLYAFETALELSYAITFWEYITIKPDLQYIIHPGIDKSYDNAFAGFLRFIIEF